MTMKNARARWRGRRTRRTRRGRVARTRRRRRRRPRRRRGAPRRWRTRWNSGGDGGEGGASRAEHDDIMGEQERRMNAAILDQATRVVLGGRRPRRRRAGAADARRVGRGDDERRVGRGATTRSFHSLATDFEDAFASPPDARTRASFTRSGNLPSTCRSRRSPRRRGESHEVLDVQPVVLVLEDDGGGARDSRPTSLTPSREDLRLLTDEHQTRHVDPTEGGTPVERGVVGHGAESLGDAFIVSAMSNRSYAGSTDCSSSPCSCPW